MNKIISLGKEVRYLFATLDRKQKNFLGGPPYSQEVNREISNYKQYIEKGLPARKRTRLGTYILDDKQNVIGYQSSTIMQLANPTTYEQLFTKLNEPMDYVQLKKILVHPNYFGKGVSNKLLETSFDFAKEHDKDWVVDVNAKNKRMIHFLNKHSIVKRNEWNTPKDTLMYRMGK